MNNSGFESVSNFDLFVKKHVENSDIIFLTSYKDDQTIKYKVTSDLDEDISDYAFQRLAAIAQACSQSIDWDKRCKLIKISDLIVQDFEKIHRNRGIFSRAINQILVGFNCRHSEQEIRLLHCAIKAPSLGEKVSKHQAEQLIETHRHPKMTAETYNKVCLTNVYFETRVADLLKENEEILKGLKEPQLAIFKARLKEKAAKEVYHNELAKRINENYYHPAVIPREIEKILGPLSNISRIQFNDQTLDYLLTAECEKYAHHLTGYQKDYIKNDVKESIALYLKAFTNKTHRNAFVLGRDLIRLAVYQEIFDKASFSGSDHGSKHIHHNIKNVESIHQHMEKQVDYNDKDRFLERIIHFYHDIGYTVGLAAQSFACCKDHPFIGAKLIEENREYFDYYLDKQSTNILWNGVLLHAIAIPNLNPDLRKVEGMHPGMIRAVVSISDACAVTYDRKTQEFWEQSIALLALVRLRLFLIKYPHYIHKLSHSGQDEWYDLDKMNPMDVFAHDVFQNTKRVLYKAVERYDVPEDKKSLFRQAIDHQFNSFTSAITLGQFGGVLTDVSAIRSLSEIPDDPKFIPQFDLAPSIIYGTLHDLFGPELAQASFKKLVDEFSGELGVLAKEVEDVVEKLKHSLPISKKIVKTGNAFFVVQAPEVNSPKNLHFNHMQRALIDVVTKIDSIYPGKRLSLSEKDRVIEVLKAFRLGNLTECKTFGDFVIAYVLPNLRILHSSEAIKEIQLLTKIVKEDLFEIIKKADRLWNEMIEPFHERVFSPIRQPVDRFIKELIQLKGCFARPETDAVICQLQAALIKAARESGKINEQLIISQLTTLSKNLKEHKLLLENAEKYYGNIENAIKLSLVSEEEYRFMRGKKAKVSKSDCMAQLIPSLIKIQ